MRNDSAGVNPASTKYSSSVCKLDPGSTATAAAVSVPAMNGTPALRMAATTSSSFCTNCRRAATGSVSSSAMMLFGKTRPALVLPGSRRILKLRIVAVVDYVNQPLPALPYQGRHLPGVIAGKLRDERFTSTLRRTSRETVWVFWDLSETRLRGWSSLQILRSDAQCFSGRRERPPMRG